MDISPRGVQPTSHPKNNHQDVNQFYFYYQPFITTLKYGRPPHFLPPSSLLYVENYFTPYQIRTKYVDGKYHVIKYFHILA